MSALSGLRVLDLTNLLPGPYAAMTLADFGAEVLKIERPGTGDPGRHTAPLVEGVSTRFAQVNRNKRSVTIDLKHAGGKAVFLDLVRTADVLMEGFRPGVMARLGLDYVSLCEINPRLIFCSLSGYGAAGPYREDAGHDLNYLSLAGLLAMSGGRLGEPAIPPTQIADLAGGSLQAVLGILLALVARQHTGAGQLVDVALFDGAFALQVEALAYEQAGQPALRGQTRLTGRYPCYQVYPTRDGQYVAVAANERAFWANLCAVLERPDLVDQQFAEGAQAGAIIDSLRETFRQRTRNEWTVLCAGKDTCCTPVLQPAEAFASEQVKARGLLVDLKHPQLGRMRQMAQPTRLSATPARYERPAPALSHDTEMVLVELGYTPEQIAALRAQGAL